MVAQLAAVHRVQEGDGGRGFEGNLWLLRGGGGHADPQGQENEFKELNGRYLPNHPRPLKVSRGS